MTLSLQDLPNEILHQIFLYLPPEYIPKLQQVCTRFNGISQPFIWRYHCQTQFRFWSPSWRIQEKFDGLVHLTDWKAVFRERHELDRSIRQSLDSILRKQSGRIAEAEAVVSYGYDAKDTLLRNLQVEETSEDVLARRYYSDSVLGSLHRSMAIDQWALLSAGYDIPLEKALGAFDMSVLHGREGDFEDISKSLDQIADRICDTTPELDEMTPRQKCIAIAKYLISYDLVGVKGNVNANYHNMQNNFIGIALQDPSHPSLPLVSVAIYCCVAQRLGLDAHPCGFPFHVIAVISPPEGMTMDGRELREDQAEERLYMDPFRSHKPVETSDLMSQLTSLGITGDEHRQYLGPSPTAEIVRRCAKNIITSVQALPRQNGPAGTSEAECFPEMDGAFYASLWALTMLVEGHTAQDDAQRASFLPYIVQRAESLFPYDFDLIESHLLPRLGTLERHDEIANTIRVIRAGDNMSKQVKPRASEAARSVRYTIGQYFQHRRYHYNAVITGWDVECLAGEQWITRMRVNELSRGKHQSFYHVQVDDGSTRYVAEDNITISKTFPTSNLLKLAGQHFKRWDGASNAFVSNIRDEYPDD